MYKYWIIFKNDFASSLEYRSNLISMVVLDFISIGGAVLLWTAIYQTNTPFAGYEPADTVMYYILITLVSFLTSIRVSSDLGTEIKNGTFSNYLVRPFRVSGYYLAKALAQKCVYLMFVLPAYVIILIIGNSKLSLGYILAAVLMIILGLLLHFILDFNVAMLAFWFQDVWSFRHIKEILFRVLGGVSFPLEFLSGTFKQVFTFFPFKYFYYVPVSYLMAKRDLSNLTGDIVSIGLWALFLIGLATLLWYRGLKIYGAVGN